MTSPTELANALGIDARAVRAWLRSHRDRPATGRWELDMETVDEIRAAFARREPARASNVRATDRERDEDYVLRLIDEVVGERGDRQHTFGWLLGDPNATGRRARLRVDAYYEGAGLVVEYRERQHFEPVRHFDKPGVMTVSGIDRGQQRERYDRLRENAIPAHGLRLWIVIPQQLVCDSAGRLTRRDHDRDVAVLAGLYEILEQAIRS